MAKFYSLCKANLIKSFTILCWLMLCQRTRASIEQKLKKINYEKSQRPFHGSMTRILVIYCSCLYENYLKQKCYNYLWKKGHKGNGTIHWSDCVVSKIYYFLRQFSQCYGTGVHLYGRTNWGRTFCKLYFQYAFSEFMFCNVLQAVHINILIHTLLAAKGIRAW